MESLRPVALILVLAGCATSKPRLDPAAKVTVLETVPVAGAKIQRDTVLLVATEYSYPSLVRGKDRLIVLFETEAGGVVEANRYILSQPAGRITLERVRSSR